MEIYLLVCALKISVAPFKSTCWYDLQQNCSHNLLAQFHKTMKEETWRADAISMLLVSIIGWFRVRPVTTSELGAEGAPAFFK
jgi:hypothetical protein